MEENYFQHCAYIYNKLFHTLSIHKGMLNIISARNGFKLSNHTYCLILTKNFSNSVLNSMKECNFDTKKSEDNIMKSTINTVNGTSFSLTDFVSSNM